MKYLPPDSAQSLISGLLRSRSQPAYLVSSYGDCMRHKNPANPASVGAAEGYDRARSGRKPNNPIHLTHRSA